MPLPVVITDLSTTASLNYPSGSVDPPSSLDDTQRAHASFIAQLRDGYATTGSGGSALVGFTPAGTGAVATTAQAKLRQFPTPEDYYLTADAGDWTSALQKLFDANDSVILPSGANYVVTAPIDIRSGMYIYSAGATISRSSSNSAILSATNVNDWCIDGKLTLEGSGNASGTAKGLHITGCNRYTVRGVHATDIDGWGFFQQPGTYVAPRGDQGQFSDCRATDCYYGMDNQSGSGAEYCTWTNFQVTGCTFGISITAGNTVFIGGNCTENGGGFFLAGGTNHAHGMTLGMNINHNTSWNLKTDAVTLGHDFVGCHFYGDSGAGAGKIWSLNSKGVVISGGQVDAQIVCDGTTGPLSFDGVTFAGSYTSVAGTNPGYVYVSNCRTLNGPSSLNDAAPVFVSASRATSAQSIVSGDTLIFNTESVDNRAAYNTATGVFTAPANGTQVYEITVAATITATSGLTSASYLEIVVNGTTTMYIPLQAISGTIAIANGSIEIAIAAAATVSVKAVLGGAPVGAALAVSTSRLAIALKA